MKKHQIKPKFRDQAGMTLIELMVATVILSIIVSVALPSMRDIFSRKSAESISTLFERSIKLARAEATQRSVNVAVKPTSNTNSWSQGWRIEYTDATGNPQLIKLFDALPNSPVFTSDTFNKDTDLIILPTGQVQTPGNFDLYYPGCTGNERYGFQLLLSGIISKGISACP